MSTQTLRVRLSGERPLLMHSARLADPLDPITVELDCVSAWNKDPVFGVIGIQSGPRH